ncbi:MAG: LysR family transcriptional regulator [Proteobacteria bacterium]|nr:LysR family transcriptional regulator [Pseudomonadota bacterium]
MNKFEQLESFVAVVDNHSFSAAGEKMGVAKSVLSRRISELEKRLGVQLLQRTTRKLSLTDSGRHFYQRSVGLLSDLSEAEQMVADAQGNLSGKIKLAAPLGLGIEHLSKPITEFMNRHPEIEIDINLNDRHIDLIEEGFDLAVRIGHLQDSSLIARKLASVHFAVCASPEYLEKHGEPGHPSELSAHQVLVYTNAPIGSQWGFQENGKRVTPRVKYRLSANNGELLAKVASLGLAITAGPLFYLQGYIERGELVPILRQFKQSEIGMYAVYPPGRLVSSRVKMLSDYLRAHFQDKSI